MVDRLATPGMIPLAIDERTSFDPLSAGGLLLGVLISCTALGGLLGWAAGSFGIGLATGALVGMPAGAFAVYRRFRGVI
jgi:hypothetical protein